MPSFFKIPCLHLNELFLLIWFASEDYRQFNRYWRFRKIITFHNFWARFRISSFSICFWLFHSDQASLCTGSVNSVSSIWIQIYGIYERHVLVTFKSVPDPNLVWTRSFKLITKLKYPNRKEGSHLSCSSPEYITDIYSCKFDSMLSQFSMEIKIPVRSSNH